MTLRRLKDLNSVLFASVVAFVLVPGSAWARNLCEFAFSDAPVFSELVQFRHDRIDPDLLRAPEGHASPSLKYTELRLPEGTRLTEAEVFRHPSDLIIGVDSTGNTKGHMYVVVNGIRYDGRMFFAPSTVETAGWHVPSGLMLRYRDVPFETKARIVEWMESGQTTHAPTCVASACKLLFDIADFQQRPNRYYWFPDHMVRYIVETSPLSGKGRTLPFEIFTVNSDFKTFWNNLPSWRTVPRFIFKVLFDPYTWGRPRRDPPVQTD